MVTRRAFLCRGMSAAAIGAPAKRGWAITPPAPPSARAVRDAGPLQMLEVLPPAVRQVRVARWSHAQPASHVGLIADQTAEQVRRPIDGKIFLVNQDNWALPAVENRLLDGDTYAAQVSASL